MNVGENVVGKPFEHHSPCLRMECEADKRLEAKERADARLVVCLRRTVMDDRRQQALDSATAAGKEDKPLHQVVQVLSDDKADCLLVVNELDQLLWRVCVDCCRVNVKVGSLQQWLELLHLRSVGRVVEASHVGARRCRCSTGESPASVIG